MNRITASHRLQRLLALVPWVAEHDGPTVQEVCARFELRPSELVDELNLVSLVGLPPYTPDELFDVVISDDRVFVHLSPSFDRSLRLTPEQALTLVAAGASLRSVPGHDPEGPLARGLVKLASALGVDPGAVIDIDLGRAAAHVLDTVRAAVAARRRLRLDYYVHGRDDHTQREVDPHRLWADQGQWYLVGFDHLRREQRVYRVDRITNATTLDAVFEAPAEEGPTDLFHPGDDAPRVVVDLSPEAAWVLEAYPTECAELGAEGHALVTLAVGGRPWLERLLLRLGPNARVVDAGADPGLERCGADAAARVRARY
ncbi:MAG: helix-turn-helix transcriptional regulator [Acidimicrobiales bacterium]